MVTTVLTKDVCESACRRVVDEDKALLRPLESRAMKTRSSCSRRWAKTGGCTLKVKRKERDLERNVLPESCSLHPRKLSSCLTYVLIYGLLTAKATCGVLIRLTGVTVRL